MAPHLKVPLALKPSWIASLSGGNERFWRRKSACIPLQGPGFDSPDLASPRLRFFFRSGSPPWGFLWASWFSYLDQKKKKKNHLNFQRNLEKSRRKASSVMYHSCDPIYFDLIYSKCSETWKLAS